MRKVTGASALVVSSIVLALTGQAEAQYRPHPADPAYIAAARAMVAICSPEGWQSWANVFTATHPELPNFFGVVQLPPEFPPYPAPCNPTARAVKPSQTQTAALRTLQNMPRREDPTPAWIANPPSMSWAGPANWSGPLGWGPYSANNVPSGLYVGGSFGASQTQGEASNTRLITLAVVDPTASVPFSGNASFVHGGLFFGANLVRAMGFLFGVEFGAEWADKNEAFIGNVPNTTLGTNTDRLALSQNTLMYLSGTVTAPVNQNFSVFGRGGGSWLNADVIIGCRSSCTAAGTAPFESTQSTDFNGWHWGVGAQGRIGTVWDRPIFLRGEYVRHVFDAKTVGAGTTPTAFIDAQFQPTVDQFKASVVVPLFDIPTANAPMSWSAGPVQFSDVRVKRDVVRVGELANGLGLYRFKYLDGDQDYVGVMAQEVRLLMPAAIATGADGIMRVDYGKVGCSFQTWDQYQASTEAL